MSRTWQIVLPALAVGDTPEEAVAEYMKWLRSPKSAVVFATASGDTQRLFICAHRTDVTYVHAPKLTEE